MQPDKPRCGVYPGSFHPLTVAHVAIAEAAITQLDLGRLDLALSRSAFDKEHLDDAIEERTEVLRRFANHRTATGRSDPPRADAGSFGPTRATIEVVVVDERLIADVARGYDAVVMGADKWHQLHELRFYDNDPAARDQALASLPQVAVAPRQGWTAPPQHRLHVAAEFSEVSATAVRAGRHEWRATPAQHR